MYINMTSRDVWVYTNLAFKVIRGHWRSKPRDRWRSKCANSGYTLTTTLRDAIFFMYICMTLRDIWIYTNLTSKVSRGHWRSQTLIWCHTLTTKPRGAIFCMYTNVKSKRFRAYLNLTSEVIRGHWRSNWGHTVSITLRDVLFFHVYTYILILSW